MKTVLEMDLDKMTDVLYSIAWNEVEKARIFGEYNDDVVVFTDGTWTIQGSGTYYRDPVGIGVMGYLKCWGLGNTDFSLYLDGFAHDVEDDEGNPLWVDDYDGTVYGDRTAALEAAIDAGDVVPEEYVDEILRQVEETIQEQDHREEEKRLDEYYRSINID